MLTSLIVMLPHTDGLEHTNVPTSGSYFLLVTPSKLRRLMSEMVRLEGYCYGQVVSSGWGRARKGGKGTYLLAESDVLLPVALRYLDCVIDVVDFDAVVGDV